MSQAASEQNRYEPRSYRRSARSVKSAFTVSSSTGCPLVRQARHVKRAVPVALGPEQQSLMGHSIHPGAHSRVKASGCVPGRRGFDSRRCRAHPNHVRSFLRRVASVVCVLALAQSAVAACAGWQATPEARRQCCEDGACPLHHHEDGASRTQIAQSAADDCCAQSQRHDSSPSGTVFASTMTLAVIQSPPPVVLSRLPLVPLSAPWETPSPPTHLAKHLLFSVLLV